MSIDIARYELPPEGNTLLGYIVRRMHKTAWLLPVPDLLMQGDSVEALKHIAIYTAAASTTYGRAYYQPSFNATGEEVSEADPATDASVSARLNSRSPHYHISYNVRMLNGDTFEGEETITGTTIGLRGLGMPAPSRFQFVSGDYNAELIGTITSELGLSITGRPRIRAHGSLQFDDSLSNQGHLVLNRDSDVKITINDRVMHYRLDRLPTLTAVR